MGEMASFYKCALQVNSFTYAKYRGKKPDEEEHYNQNILKHCLDNDIKIVGLADHGSVTSSESLREYLSEHGIVVFPGFEISTAEKIHIVCLFSDELDFVKLNQILGDLGLSQTSNGTEPSELSCLEIAEKIEKHGGFWYAAHITNDNGILKIHQMQHIWKSDKLVAAQIPGGLDEIDPDYKNIINNTDKIYFRNRKPAYINASDIESPEDLDKDNASVLIKMSSPTFDNFRMAFKDPESRIRLNSERENSYQSSFQSISVLGGYLDGLSVNFSENLATIIGGRGTGKSTLISAIRYALDMEPADKDEAKYFRKMIEHNLGGGSVITLKIKSNAQHGQEFIIRRRFKNVPVILTLDEVVSSFKVKDILPTVEIYGQNEITEIAEDKDLIREVTSRLISIDESTMEELRMAHDEIIKNGNEISEIEEKIEKTQQDIEELQKSEENLKFYEDTGMKEKLAPFEKLSREEAQFATLANIVKNSPNPEFNEIQIDKNIQGLELFKKLCEEIRAFNNEVNMLSKRYKECKENLVNAYEECYKQWESRKCEYDAQLRTFLKSTEGIRDQTAMEVFNEYNSLIKKIEVFKPQEEKNHNLINELEKLQAERKNLIEKYRMALDCKRAEANRSLKKINKKKLNGRMQLGILFGQNKKPLIDYLTNKVPGVGEKSLAGISEYPDFDVFSFTGTCRAGIDSLQNEYNLTHSVAEKIKDSLNAENLREIEEMELKDIIEIKLAVSDGYKKLENLSKGQQCTAILNLLLLDNKDPLIIDQPEDNLDNSFIAENLVRILRENKIKRQYILATHNANIPVFGDAEQIITMEEVDGNGKIVQEGLGSIDDIGVRKHVIEILEGGTDAFKMREEKYGI